MNPAYPDECESVAVHAEYAADWIIRSAHPSFLSLFTLTDEATYFSKLPPFISFTPKGRIRVWQGAGVRF